MEPWPQGCVEVAVAFLLLLLLLGGQSQGSTPGSQCDCARDFQRGYGSFCCKGCPMGHYMKAPCTEPCGDSTCLPCPQGTFLTRESHFKTRCIRCQTCDEKASQVALENCSAVADTRCGCQPGWRVECTTKPCRENSPFFCSCQSCETPPLRLCMPGFYENVNGCLSCPTSSSSSCPEACFAICGWRRMFLVQVLLASLVVPLLLGVTLIYTYRRCQPCKPVVPADTAGTEPLSPAQTTHLSVSDTAHTLLASPGSSEKVCSVQLVGSSWTAGFCQAHEVPYQQVPQSWDQPPNRALGPPVAPPAGSSAAVLQPGPQLYDVMDAVPARRWKEFVRTLGLREAEIEAVEVEVCRFRDQQYEMLKRWRQQQPAGLGAIYAALERMGLEGCAEDLRSRLQRGP